MRDIINLNLNLDYSKRILCVSDIHGGYVLLDRCLKRVNYDPEKDYLILLGDVINRGEHSLDSINYIIELCKKKNVYMIKGNHEEDFYNRNDLQYDMIKTYVTKKTSLLYDLLKDIDSSNMSEDEIFNYAYKNYKYIFDFINQLPDMIETSKFIFVHSAYFDENNISLGQEEVAFRADSTSAEQSYTVNMAYTVQGGSRTFTDLLKNAGLATPFDEVCLQEVCDTATRWLTNFDLTGIE